MRRINPKYDVDPLASRTSMHRASGQPARLRDKAACALCRTAISGARAQFDWECRRCGQRWTALRLATVASYATWVDARELAMAPVSVAAPTVDPR
jgi:ribosomal protein L37AE/L43A